MSLVIVITAIAGAILVYAAVKGIDPRTVIKSALKRG